MKTEAQSDCQMYREMLAAMNHMVAKFGKLEAVTMPEYAAAWRAIEAIKNRNGGYPPKP